MSRPLRWYDYITINIYWLGLTTLSQTLTPLVVPLLVQQFVGEAFKGTFYGTLRLWTLMVALLVQALMGMLSDRSMLRWGRRRPFILTGTVADLVILSAIGLSAGMSGMAGYWFLFGMIILLMIASNTAHAAQQGLIPDLAPDDKRGRFSGINAFFDVPLPLILVPFTIAKLISAGNLWGGLLLAMGILTLSMLLTMLAPEKQRAEKPPALDWQPFLRLLGMTALFTTVILGVGSAIPLAGRALREVESVTVLVGVMGLTGLLAMGIAVALGVWASVQISIGRYAASSNPSFTWWVVSRLAYLVGSTNLASFAVYFLQGRLGLVREQAAGPAAMLMLFVGVFVLIVSLVSSAVADKIGHRRLLVIAGIVAFVGAMVAIAAPNLLVIYGSGCLIGIATGLFYTSNWALGTRIVQQAEAGRYLGISNLAGAGAGAVGAYIGGPIADYITARAPGVPGLGYVLLFAIYGIMFLISVVALRWVKEPPAAQG